MPETINQMKQAEEGRAGDRRAFLARLAAHGIQLNKQLGQNFIFDSSLADEICTLAGIGATDTVLEIGSGAGTLTESLAQFAEHGCVLSCEIDRSLQALLEERFATHKQVQVLFADALSLDFAQVLDAAKCRKHNPETAVRVAANLPYYITTDLIIKLLSELPQAVSMCLMVQEEAAPRILAKPGQSKLYGPLAALVQLYGEGRIVKRIPRHLFVPEPHVDSVLIKLEKVQPEEGGLRQQAYREGQAFFSFIGEAFAQRRKTLVNNLSMSGKYGKAAIKASLQGLGLSESCRAEALDWQSLVQIFLALKTR